jgi:hypothetical protein
MVSNFAPKAKVLKQAAMSIRTGAKIFTPIRHQQSSSRWDENGAPNVQVCYGARPQFSATILRDNALDAQ